MKPFRPGEVVTLREQDYKIVATNHDGKLILSPLLMKEGIADMAMRLQSTIAEPSTVKVEVPKEP